MKEIIIAPSLLSADFNKINKEINTVKRLGAKWLHFDVMDGHFVNNVSFGLPFVKSVAKESGLINDVHIMVENPMNYVEPFSNINVNYLTFHYEACRNDQEVMDIINKIHSNNMKAGLSIKPNTKVDAVLPFLKDLDLLLIMSVEPGFGGQEFISSSLDKIKKLRNYIDKNKLSCLIEVDGGINENTFPLVKNAGIDVVVTGSYLFGHKDIKQRYKKLR